MCVCVLSELCAPSICDAAAGSAVEKHPVWVVDFRDKCSRALKIKMIIQNPLKR